MFCTVALRRNGVLEKDRIGSKIFNKFGGLSDQTGWGSSVINDRPKPILDPICLRAHWRWYSLISSSFGPPLLDRQNQQLRSAATKNLLGACSDIRSSLRFGNNLVRSFVVPWQANWRWYSSLSRSLQAPPLYCQNQQLRSMAVENLFSAHSVVYPCSSFGYIPVRSFAAPVQAKPKLKPALDSHAGPRLNEAITAPFVRLVTDEGHGIVSRREALDLARKLDLDLVEVQRNANPPVCKIMDFHKEKFKQEVKEKERSKSKSAVSLRSGENKEVRFKAKTELKDLKIKAETVVRLMERGYRVKCTAMPTGKEDEDLGGLLSRLLSLIEDVSVVESGPHLDSRQAYVIVRHMKFATKKSGKKISKVVDTVAKGFQGAVPCTSEAASCTSQDEKTLLSEEEWEPVDCGSEADDVAQAEQSPQRVSLESTTSLEKDFKEEADWTYFNSTKDSGDLFDFDSNEINTNSGFNENMDNVSSHAHSMDKNICDTSHQRLPVAPAVGGLTAPKPGLGSLRSVLEMSKERSVQGANRYSKQTETKGRFHQPNSTDRNNATPNLRAAMNQGRIQQEPMRSGGQRNQFDPKQRQFSPSTPSRSSPGNLNVAKTPDSGDQGRFGSVARSKANDTDSPSKGYGIFSSKSAATGNGRNLANSSIGKPGDAGSHTPTYGIFSTPKAVPHGELRKLGDETVGKHRTTSPILSNGNSSTQKPAASSNQNSGDSPTGKPSSSTPPTPRYGIFSATNIPSSDK